MAFFRIGPSGGTVDSFLYCDTQYATSQGTATHHYSGNDIRVIFSSQHRSGHPEYNAEWGGTIDFWENGAWRRLLSKTNSSYQDAGCKVTVNSDRTYVTAERATVYQYPAYLYIVGANITKID